MDRIEKSEFWAKQSKSESILRAYAIYTGEINAYFIDVGVG